MRIIINNVINVTLDIVENVPPQTSSCARIYYEFIYYLRIVGSCATGKPSLENVIKASWNSVLVDARGIAS